MARKSNFVKKNGGLLKKYKDNYELLIMALPGIIALILFAYLPMGGLVIAFKDYRIYDGIFGSPWVGLKHFRELFQSTDFIRALKNTFVISFFKILIGFPAPLLFALLLNEIQKTFFKKTVQTFSYLPHFFSWIVLSGIIKQIFSTTGAVNYVLSKLGADEPLNFFGSKVLFLIMILITSVWKESGWGSIIYLAAITGVDPELYDAAKVDGAGRFRQTINITIPSLVPTIITLFILRLASVLNIGIDQIYSLYNQMVYDIADILDTYVLRILQSSEFSYGTAVGMFKSVVSLVFVLCGNSFVKKISNGEQGIL